MTSGGRRRPRPRPGEGTALVLYARVPRPGRVKTRLSPPLTPDEACRLHIALLEDGARILKAAARRTGAAAWVAFSAPWEPATGSALASALRGFRRLPQGPGDLGRRMRRTLGDLFRRGWAAVVLVGGDVPTLPVARLAQACRALRSGADLVLGPATDGGYYLVGLRRDRPGLFRGVPWGTADVLRVTLRQARRLRLAVVLLRPWHDVDRLEDLLPLRRELRARGRRRAPRTTAILEALARGGRLVS